MSGNGKKPGVAFWASASLFALLVYFLSYPWVEAVVVSTGFPEPAVTIVHVFYTPFGWVAERCPDWLCDRYDAYILWVFRVYGVPKTLP